MFPFSKVRAFISRIKSALTSGAKLSKKDTAVVIDLLEKAMLREYIYTVAILHILGDKKIPKKVVDKLADMFSKGAERIVNGKAPFTDKEEAMLMELLEEYGLTKKEVKRLLAAFTAVRGTLLSDGFAMLYAKTKKKQREELA